MAGPLHSRDVIDILDKLWVERGETFIFKQLVAPFYVF